MYSSIENFIAQFPPAITEVYDQDARVSALAKLSQEIDQLQLRLKVPVITVTGTNGKGSTIKAIVSVLQQHGLKVGALTSPHLITIGERITINQQALQEQDFLNLANTIRKQSAVNKFYDFILLMALRVFKQAAVDVVVLEVGIGGRLDSVNALDADVVVLTNVGLDHTHLLGNTREAIVNEKIALLRAGKIFVCGDNNPPASIKNKIFSLTPHAFWIDCQFGFYANDYWLPTCLLPNLPQSQLVQENVACAMMAIHALFGKNFLKEKFLCAALDKLQLVGRCQVLNYNGVEIVLDVAHNPAATQHLANFLSNLPPKPTVAIFGMMKDKDISASLQALKSCVDTWCCCDIDEQRGEKSEQLKNILQQQNIAHEKALTCNSIQEAWHLFQKNTKHNERVVFFGSFRVVEAIMKMI